MAAAEKLGVTLTAEMVRSVRTAARPSDRLYANCQKTGNHPYTARVRPELMPGLRLLSFVRSAMVAYVIEDNVVRITNIFWAGQDYEAFYLDDDERG